MYFNWSYKSFEIVVRFCLTTEIKKIMHHKPHSNRRDKNSPSHYILPDSFTSFIPLQRKKNKINLPGSHIHRIVIKAGALVDNAIQHLALLNRASLHLLQTAFPLHPRQDLAHHVDPEGRSQGLGKRGVDGICFFFFSGD